MITEITSPPATTVDHHPLRAWSWLEWISGSLLILLGLSIRVALFAQFRSLWLDESMLANNITTRGFRGLTHTLDDGQGAPIGFLFVERFLWNFSKHDWMLRVAPLLSAAAALILLLLLAKQFLKPSACLLALCFASVSIPWVYYSSEVKQYSTDVAVGLGLLNLAAYVLRRVSLQRCLILGLVGALSVWFSHPSVFILACIGMALAISVWNMPRKDRHFSQLTVVAVPWLLSMLLEYRVSLRELSHSTGLKQYWEAGYIPYKLHAVNWFFRATVGAFRSPGGFLAADLAAVIAAIGAVWLCRSTQSRPFAWMILAPFCVALFAAAIHVYPFDGRLILYLVPLGIICISAGIDYLWQLNCIETRLAAVLSIALLLGYSVRDMPALFHRDAEGSAFMVAMLSIPPVEDMKSLIGHIEANRKPGDLIVLHPLAKPAYSFYSRQSQLSAMIPSILAWTNGAHSPSVPELGRASRAWVIFDHTSKDADGVSDEVWWLDDVKRAGFGINIFRAQGCLLVLLDRPAMPLIH